ncbi:MAG: hypothetical protein Q9227_008103 [Pyrenula ochraceoflavens]
MLILRAQSTEKRSALRITREAELLGGLLSAYHNRESLVLRAKFLKEDLPYFTELLAEVVSRTRYTPYELDEDVVRVMRTAQKKILASPLKLAINSVHGIAFHRGLGTPQYPVSTTPFTKYLDSESIASYASSAYAKPNIAVVANGADHDDFGKWVQEFFKEFPAAGAKLESSPTKYYGGEERIAHGSSNAMILGFPGSSSFTSGSSYKPEMSVLAALLGGESSIKWSSGFSLLSKAAADVQHAHVSTQNASYSDAGLFYVAINGEADEVSKTARNVVAALKKVAAGDISSEDIAKAVALAKFNALEAGQQTDAGIEATGIGLITGGRPHQMDEVAKSIEQVKDAKVKAAAKSLLDTKASVATVGDLFVLPFAEELGLRI